jgi:hypothetical protein
MFRQEGKPGTEMRCDWRTHPPYQGTRLPLRSNQLSGVHFAAGALGPGPNVAELRRSRHCHVFDDAPISVKSAFGGLGLHPETASGYDGIVATERAGAKTGMESDRWGWNPLRDHIAKTTARPEFALIALICAGYEKTIQKDAWRSAGQVHYDYLTQLVKSNKSSSTRQARAEDTE